MYKLQCALTILAPCYEKVWKLLSEPWTETFTFWSRFSKEVPEHFLLEACFSLNLKGEGWHSKEHHAVWLRFMQVVLCHRWGAKYSYLCQVSLVKVERRDGDPTKRNELLKHISHPVCLDTFSGGKECSHLGGCRTLMCAGQGNQFCLFFSLVKTPGSSSFHSCWSDSAGSRKNGFFLANPKLGSPKYCGCNTISEAVILISSYWEGKNIRA